MRTRRCSVEPKVELLCEGCLQKKPQFFKVLIGDFKERLRIPPAFMKKLAIKESGRAVVQDLSSRCWDIEILRAGNEMIFGKGWKKFVEGNDLETGDFLVFRYEGELRFTVIIFDKSACQKELSGGDFSANPINDLIHLEDHEENRPPPSHKGEKGRSASSNAWDAASSFMSVNPTFKKMMTDSCVHRMIVPDCFSSAYLPKGNPLVLKLRNQRGMQWDVKYHNKWRVLTSGWRHFFLENHLKKGDVCVFEFINKPCEFNVHLFRDTAT